MFIQSIMLLVGGAFHNGDDVDFTDHSGFDHDGGIDVHDDSSFDHEHDHDGLHAGSGLRLFTVRGIVAFFAIGGWVGLASFETTQNAGVSLLCSVLSGTLALIFAALVIKWALKLQNSGNINPRNAIGSMATVYIPIPPQRRDTGKVNVTVQGQFSEMDAVTDGGETLKTGTSVQIVGVLGQNVMIVRAVA
jgi:membrane protein implicated in regulation of membrane protease activity